MSFCTHALMRGLHDSSYMTLKKAPELMQMELTGSYFKPNILQKLGNTIAAFAVLPYAVATIVASFVDLSSREKLFEYFSFQNNALDNAWKVLIPLIIIYTLIWHIKDVSATRKSKPFPNDKMWYFGILSSRVMFAIVLSEYGFAKLLGTQFSRPYLLYGTELGDFDGSLVTVAFFSYSAVYGNAIGILQIVCSLALLYRRTARLGFLILLPVLANILFIDFTFDGWEGPRIIISSLMYILLFNLFCDYKEMKEFLLGPQGAIPGKKTIPSIVPLFIRGNLKAALKVLVIFLVIIFSFNALYRTKEAITYAPGYSDVMDGAWYSEKVEQYNDSLRVFENSKNQIKFFVGDQAAVIKRLGESSWYDLNFDLTGKGHVEMVAHEDSLKTRVVNGKYFLSDDNTLQIIGKEGVDSIRWLFRKKN